MSVKCLCLEESKELVIANGGTAYFEKVCRRWNGVGGTFPALTH